MAVNTPFWILYEDGDDSDIYLFEDYNEAKIELINQQKYQIEEEEGTAILYKISYTDIFIKTQVASCVDGEITWHN